MVDNIRASPYQQPLNITGYITSNKIGNAHRFEPCQNFHSTRTTLYNSKPFPLVIGNPFPRSDNFTTTNQVYHKEKYPEVVHPEYPKAPGIDHVAFIRPELSKRVERAFRLDPIHDTSESHDQFRIRRIEFDLYGGPKIHTRTRDLYARSHADYIYPFDPAEHSVLRMTHPYMTTNLMYHREFTPDEMDHFDMLKETDAHNKYVPDVAIKYRVRPMHDAFEQKLTALCILPNLDAREITCDLKNKANLKIGFRRQLYNGTAPRTFQPVEHLGCLSSYTANFSNPWRQYNKESTTHENKYCFVQPRGVSFAGAMKVPNMYSTESGIYGTGRCVDAFVRTEQVAAIDNPK